MADREGKLFTAEILLGSQPISVTVRRSCLALSQSCHREEILLGSQPISVTVRRCSVLVLSVDTSLDSYLFWDSSLQFAQ
eukprot:g59705.t1